MRFFKISLSILTIAIISCQPASDKPEKKQDCWALTSSDKVLEVGPSTQKLYQPFEKVDLHMIPLVQAIDGQNYDVFIGMSEQLRSEQLYEAQLNGSSRSIIGIRKNKGKSGRKYYDFFMRNDTHFIFRSMYDRSNPETTVVINIVSEDSARIRAYFNASSFLEEKLACNN